MDRLPTSRMATAEPRSRNIFDHDNAKRAYIENVKSALPLGATIERLSNIKLQKTSGGFKTCCPFHDDKTPSLHVREDRGLFCCFGAGCGAEGDVLDFVQKWFGVGFSEALARAGELAGLPPPGAKRGPPGKPRDFESTAWRAAVPQRRKPAAAPLVPSSKFLKPFPQDLALPRPGELVAVRDDERSRIFELRPTHVHRYKGIEGETRCLVLRAESRSKGKFFVQVGFNDCEGAAMRSPWPLVRFPAGTSRPVYGLEDVRAWLDSNGAGILLVEGEKTRDCAAKLLPIRSTGILVLSNMGGCNAASQADWSPVVDAIRSRGELVEPVEAVVWPDADKPAVRPNGQVVDSQAAYAESLERSLSAAGAAGGVKFTFRRVKPPSGVEPGWDLADAYAEGWTREHVLAAIERGGVRLGLDEFLPPMPRFRGGDEPHSHNRTDVSAPSNGISSACGADASSFIPELSPAPN